MTAANILDGAFKEACGTRPRLAKAPDFPAILGPDWNKLPPAVQARFAHRQAAPYSYRGRFGVVRASLWGRLIARACRLLGTPLAPYEGRDLASEVSISPHVRGGQVWRRSYAFPGARPLTVTSIKRAGPGGTVDECVGLGFGMCLKVTVEEGVLHFRSLYHFWQVGPVRLRLPDLLTPGRAHVMHIDLGTDEHGKAAFRFRFASVHPYWGRIYYQDGVFHDPEDQQQDEKERDPCPSPYGS